MIVRGSWPYDGEDGRSDPRQSSRHPLGGCHPGDAGGSGAEAARVTGVVEALERLADVDQREAA